MKVKWVKEGKKGNPTNIHVKTHLSGLLLSGTQEGKNICQLCDPCMFITIQSWIPAGRSAREKHQLLSVAPNCCRGGRTGDSVVNRPAQEHLCLLCMVSFAVLWWGTLYLLLWSTALSRAESIWQQRLMKDQTSLLEQLWRIRNRKYNFLNSFSHDVFLEDFNWETFGFA